MELELTEEEARVLGEALECLIAQPVTDDDTREVAIDLAHHLLALAAGYFDDWDVAVNAWEDAFTQAGIDAREQQKTSHRDTLSEMKKAGLNRRLDCLEERLMRGTTSTLANDPMDW